MSDHPLDLQLVAVVLHAQSTDVPTGDGAPRLIRSPLGRLQDEGPVRAREPLSEGPSGEHQPRARTVNALQEVAARSLVRAAHHTPDV